MAGVTTPSISSALEATLASLDALNQAAQARRRDSLRTLEAAVARLDGSFVPPDEPSSEARRSDEWAGGPARWPRPGTDPRPFVALPERTTHGGPWGPKMVEKLTAQALAKRGW